MEPGPHSLFSLDVLHLVKPFLGDFFNWALCHWSSENAEREGSDILLRIIFSVPPQSRAQSTGIQKSWEISAFQGCLWHRQGKLEKNYINECPCVSGGLEIRSWVVESSRDGTGTGHQCRISAIAKEQQVCLAWAKTAAWINSIFNKW